MAFGTPARHLHQGGQGFTSHLVEGLVLACFGQADE